MKIISVDATVSSSDEDERWMDFTFEAAQIIISTKSNEKSRSLQNDL